MNLDENLTIDEQLIQYKRLLDITQKRIKIVNDSCNKCLDLKRKCNEQLEFLEKDKIYNKNSYFRRTVMLLLCLTLLPKELLIICLGLFLEVLFSGLYIYSKIRNETLQSKIKLNLDEGTYNHDMAYRCLNDLREQRTTLYEAIEELENCYYKEYAIGNVPTEENIKKLTR